jgi:methylglyoxal synthase
MAAIAPIAHDRMKDAMVCFARDRQAELARLRSGPVGVTPLTPLAHDGDVRAPTRLAAVYDIPMVLNRRTAELLVADPARLESPARKPDKTS